MANLAVPKKKGHNRTVTRFCDEANIGNDDQLDLAEFIVAAHYLGAGIDDGKLMDIFTQMEDANAHDGKSPKEIIKELMRQVEDQYGDELNGSSAKPIGVLSEEKEDDEKDETEHEIVGKTLNDAVTQEDAQWQEIQIDGFLSAAAQHQNLQIAKKLMLDTALTKEDVAQITGVDAKLLDEYEDEDGSDEEFESEDDGDENDESKVEASKTEQTSLAVSPASAVTNNDAVVIKSTEFGKSIALTNGDLNKLDELIKGGTDEIGKNQEDVLALLKKLQQAVKLSPGGARTLRAQRTQRKLDHQTTSLVVGGSSVDDAAAPHQKKQSDVLQAPTGHNKNQASDYKLKDDFDVSNVKLPSKFRVVITPGALVKSSIDIRSSEVAKIPIGTVVIVEHMDGRRARISAPVSGWVSLHAKDGRTILQKENTSSKEMDNAVHAQRARQTKILILKSITTLNDATVTRILEKSDWNLRRAIEAFYMAKYKTQQFMEKKQRAAAQAQAQAQTSNSNDNNTKQENSPSTDNTNNQSDPGATANGNERRSSKGGRRSVVQNWWQSWKSFSHQNK